MWLTSFLASQQAVVPPAQLAMVHRRMSQEAAAVLVDITLPRTTFDRNGILAPGPTAASVILSDRRYSILSSTPVPTHSVTGGSGVEGLKDGLVRRMAAEANVQARSNEDDDIYKELHRLD